MTLVRWSPISRNLTNIINFQDRMNRYTGNTNRDETKKLDLSWNPRVDITETHESYELFFELPGVPRENVKVDIEDGILKIHGNKESDIPEDFENQILSERPFGKFQRSFRLPKEVDSENVTALFENGILKINVPLVPKPEPKEIEIQFNK